MKQINDTTFISDNLGDLKPVVTIGGKPIDKFIPNLNMSFHNDEFFINLNRRDKQAINTTDKAEIDGIDKDIFYIDADGRFKWDIEFKERPLKNSWTWELKHAEGIEFYYQGELTAEEIADGCERPLEVVGSYAVYCNKVNNKYKTGKLCHIYRPFCYDINGESIYADLLIADGQLTITIDETWLDNASYPVRLDPTIGYTSVGTSSGGWSDWILCNCTMPENGTATAVYACLGQNVGATSTAYLGLYADESDAPGDAIERNLEVSVLNTSWYSRSVSCTLLSGSKYYPCFLPPRRPTSNTLSDIYYYYDSGSGVNGYFYNGYATMPDPAGTLNTTGSRASVYLEYTESGGSSLPTIINNYRQQGVM